MNLAKKKGISRQELIGSIGSEFPAGKGVEVGTFRGQFSKDIIERWKGTLYMVDVWSPLDPTEYVDSSNHGNFGKGEIYGAAMESISGNEDRAIMIRANSEKASEIFADGSLDFVYIDANHAYDYVVKDIELWYPKVKPGGYLCGHDYLDMDWSSDPNFAPNGKDKNIYSGSGYLGEFGVNPAVDEFCIKNGYEPIVTNEWLGSWCFKKKDSRKKIGVLVMYNEPYEEMASVTVDQNIEGYCELNGYRLIKKKIDNPKNGRAPQWQKITESIDILEESDLDWIFFIDLDCLIMNQTIKLESIIDENYSVVMPSHGMEAVDNPMEKNEFGENNIITSAFFVKNDDVGKNILKRVWECNGAAFDEKFDEFDHEGRQFRIALSDPEIKKHVKIVEEKKLNRFWHMKNPFMVLQNPGISELTWRPGDFIAHVTGYPLEERVHILRNLNVFSGGAIAKLRYERGAIYLSPIVPIDFAKIVIRDMERRQISEAQFESINHTINYYVSVETEEERLIFEAYDKEGELISKKLLTME